MSKYAKICTIIGILSIFLVPVYFILKSKQVKKNNLALSDIAAFSNDVISSLSTSNTDYDTTHKCFKTLALNAKNSIKQKCKDAKEIVSKSWGVNKQQLYNKIDAIDKTTTDTLDIQDCTHQCSIHKIAKWVNNDCMCPSVNNTAYSTKAIYIDNFGYVCLITDQLENIFKLILKHNVDTTTALVNHDTIDADQITLFKSQLVQICDNTIKLYNNYTNMKNDDLLLSYLIFASLKLSLNTFNVLFNQNIDVNFPEIKFDNVEIETIKTKCLEELDRALEKQSQIKSLMYNADSETIQNTVTIIEIVNKFIASAPADIDTINTHVLEKIKELKLENKKIIVSWTTQKLLTSSSPVDDYSISFYLDWHIQMTKSKGLTDLLPLTVEVFDDLYNNYRANKILKFKFDEILAKTCFPYFMTNTSVQYEYYALDPQLNPYASMKTSSISNICNDYNIIDKFKLFEFALSKLNLDVINYITGNNKIEVEKMIGIYTFKYTNMYSVSRWAYDMSSDIVINTSFKCFKNNKLLLEIQNISIIISYIAFTLMKKKYNIK